MHPVLFKIGSFELYSYGLMMAFAVLTGLFIADAEAKRNGWNRDQIMRLVVWTFLMGLFGSRIVFAMTLMNQPNVDMVAVLFNPRAGFVYYGGVIAAWSFVWWYLRKNRLPIWNITDAFAMGICLGLGVGRIGCFLGGCCFGKPTTHPWGVVMVRDAALGPVHPVQLYEFVALVIIFAGLWLRRKRKAYEGELTVLFAGIYAILRYILEFWRGDSVRGFLIDEYLSTSQFLSVPFLALAVYLHCRLSNKRGVHLARAKL